MRFDFFIYFFHLFVCVYVLGLHWFLSLILQREKIYPRLGAA